MSIASFSQLALKEALQQRLLQLGIKSPTLVQAQSLPKSLTGQDLVVQAKTGSGKTYAFALPMLNKVDPNQGHVQGLVLCPTRELADQVAQEIRKLAAPLGNVKVLTLCGGVEMGGQLKSLEHGAHIVVGTPGRIEDHVLQGTLLLTEVETFVLDEADQMLDMGFSETLESIAVYLPPEKQTLLFSATYANKTLAIAKRFAPESEHLEVQAETLNTKIKQRFYKLENNKLRFTTLQILLLQHQPQSCVVFCNTKAETKRLFSELEATGLSCVELHGDLDQGEREWSILTFANKSANILVATDVAARGLDIEDVDLVINYHLALEPQTHVHRIGRTGRADKQGLALSLFGEKEAFKVKQLETLYETEFAPATLPGRAVLEKPPYKPDMVTLLIEGGKKHKLRKADIVGCLTGDDGIGFKLMGKINIYDVQSFVAVKREAVKPALRKLKNSKIKGRRYNALRA